MVNKAVFTQVPTRVLKAPIQQTLGTIKLTKVTNIENLYPSETLNVASFSIVVLGV